MVNPTPGCGGVDAIERNQVFVREQTVEQESDDSTDRVFRGEI